MKGLYFTAAALTFVLFFSTSCTKETVLIETRRDTITITRRDTIVQTRTDTVQLKAKDTTFAMNVNGWDLFAYSNGGYLPAGAATYMNTSEGIKFIPQSIRSGVRLQLKNEVAFTDKTLLYKWKVNDGGQFTDIVFSVKYVPLSSDGLPSIQGIDAGMFSTRNSANNSVVVQNDTWYYTRMVPTKGTSDYVVVTATGNYDNKGGAIIGTRQTAIYTKHGYLAVRLGDPFAGSAASLVLGECKIADN